MEDKDFLSALCRAATADNKTTPVLVHITVSTGAVSSHEPTAFCEVSRAAPGPGALLLVLMMSPLLQPRPAVAGAAAGHSAPDVAARRALACKQRQEEWHCSLKQWHVGLQVREGVRTEAEALALGHQVAACPGLHLRGVMTHHGRLDVFQPIVKAFKDTFGQVKGLKVNLVTLAHARPPRLQHLSSKLL